MVDFLLCLQDQHIRDYVGDRKEEDKVNRRRGGGKKPFNRKSLKIDERGLDTPILRMISLIG